MPPEIIPPAFRTSIVGSHLLSGSELVLPIAAAVRSDTKSPNGQVQAYANGNAIYLSVFDQANGVWVCTPLTLFAAGVDTIVSATTSLAVTHSLGVAPVASDITITFGEQATNDYGRWWVDTFTTTQFTLNVSADPGASGLDFGWKVAVL
jgi:hypothetical protein